MSLCIGLEARHLIGGEITYECLGERGNGMRYKFTMRIYRDCACTGCAPFDPQAAISIYRCGASASCDQLTVNNVFDNFTVGLESITSVSPPEFPCLEIPPNICVEEGFYEFERTLPISEDSYHIIYQRCCRNVTITNIFDPEAAGTSYTTEITPAAQLGCNNSPVFNEFPPTVICADQPLEFDHSATDADGDQIIYEFCSPLLGGGRTGTSGFEGDPSACDGVSPNPPCPPPFSTVRYIQPTYTFDKPLGGKPAVEIDPNTGVISGIPNTLGQFVVGVCAKEYRNGELIGETRRDFQFNVSNCNPTVVADIRKDSVIAEQSFLLNSCGENTITFENQSFRESAINSWSWKFDIEGETFTFSQWDATVTFPDTGLYQGQLILNPGTQCGDTADIFVNIYPQIVADFDFEYDTCLAGPVTFTDLSETGAREISSWLWDFGDELASGEQHPIHTYEAPGDLQATLRITDSNGCSTGITKTISYFPVPTLLVVAPSSFVGCSPAPIFFDNLSFPVDENYGIRWDFGDGNSSTDLSPTHVYDQLGKFTVALEVTSPVGCIIDTTFRSLIEVLPGPTAGFQITPEELSNLNSTIELLDESIDAVSWFWQFDSLSNSTERQPTYTFPDTGRYVVHQTVTHANGCQDSLSRSIDIIPVVRYFLPNAFTPNNDAKNEGFRGTGVLTGITNFNLTIWDRWGEMVFETDDPLEAWNGKKFNEGKDLPNGTYLCLVKFRGPRGERKEFKSFANLIR